MGLPSRSRLRRQRDFVEVRAAGHRIPCGPFIFQCRLRDPGDPLKRFGVIASRRVGNAVKRNRGKRIFRELFRTHEALLPPASDTVVVLRASFDRHSFADLESRFQRACRNSELHATAADR